MVENQSGFLELFHLLSSLVTLRILDFFVRTWVKSMEQLYLICMGVLLLLCFHGLICTFFPLISWKSNSLWGFLEFSTLKCYSVPLLLHFAFDANVTFWSYMIPMNLHGFPSISTSSPFTSSPFTFGTAGVAHMLNRWPSLGIFQMPNGWRRLSIFGVPSPWQSQGGWVGSGRVRISAFTKRSIGLRRISTWKKRGEDFVLSESVMRWRWLYQKGKYVDSLEKSTKFQGKYVCFSWGYEGWIDYRWDDTDGDRCFGLRPLTFVTW